MGNAIQTYLSIAHAIPRSLALARKPLNNDPIIIWSMGKKIEETEVKKECPSCGLGVALDASICEFCGWDFEEEDEWILQIEKLERDLMLEKQKFEPGTVDDKIESTLHTPALERIEIMRARQEKETTATSENSLEPAPEPSRSPTSPAPPPARAMREARPGEILLKRSVAREPQPAPKEPAHVAQEEHEEKVEEPAPPKVRRVRTIKASELDKTRGGDRPATKKVRIVRKVKQ